MRGGKVCPIMYAYEMCVRACVRVRKRPGPLVSMCACEMRLSACETQQPFQRERRGWGGSNENESTNGTQTFM